MTIAKKMKLYKAIVILISLFMLLGLATPVGSSVQAADLDSLTETELALAAPDEPLQVPANAILVIDISEWQNPASIDYDLLCPQIDGVILRIGFTGHGTNKSKTADAHFERHYAEFKSRGVPVGVYWFSRAATVAEAEEEAEMTLALLAGKELDLPVYWDTEDSYYQKKTTPKLLTEVAIAYIDSIRQAGREAGIYASVNWYLNRLDMSRLWEHHTENFFEVWVAHYNSWIPNLEYYTYGLYSPQFNHDYWMWQFTSTGKLDGYKGSLDFNFRAKKGPDKIVRIDQTAPFFYEANPNPKKDIKPLADVSLLQGLDFDVYEGVIAWDDRDGKVEFTASPKTLSTKKAGTFFIDYTAVDASGNRGSHVRTVTVVATTFPDVLASHWAYGFVEDLYGQSIISGYGDGKFRPENNLTRGQAAKMIARAAGLDFEEKVADFPDVDPADEYSPYIAALAEKGAISGFLDGKFRQWDKIKRSHIAKIVALAFDLQPGTTEVSFSDLPEDPELCEYIIILASNEIVSGYETGNFGPNNPVTRAQFSKIISLAQEVAAKQSAAAEADEK